MEWVTLGLGFVGIAAAIVIPLWIERSKRPRLRIVLVDPKKSMPRPDQWMRVVGVQVVNEPIEGWLGRQLLRNTANGCTVSVEAHDLEPEEEHNWGRSFRARWSVKPDPWRPLPLKPDGTGPSVGRDRNLAAEGEVYDLAPTAAGVFVGLAFKRDQEATALFDSAVTVDLPWVAEVSAPEYTVPDETTCLLAVTVEAGGVSTTKAFRLRTTGNNYTDLYLDEVT